MIKPILSPLVFLLTTAMLSGAYANESPQAPESNAHAYLGIQTLITSQHLGSADEDVTVLPYLTVNNYKGVDIFGPSISYRAVETGTGVGFGKWSLRAGPIATYQSGRNSSDSETLTGLDDIDASLLLGGYTRATIGPVGLRLDATQDVLGGHDGLLINASVGTLLPLGRLNIQPSATVSWGNEDHNQNFFGITADQAGLSGLPRTEFGSGIYSYSLTAVSWYEISDRIAFTLIGSHRWFTGDITDSPIVLAADGSDKGFFVSVGISRKFAL